MSNTEIMISRPMGSRLVKDLKEGQNSLCQSLINISQFIDIDETFINKKKQFRISDKNQNMQNRSNKNSNRYLLQAKQDNIEMTPEQKIQIYRKEKIKEKYRLKFDQKVLKNGEQKRIFRLRKAKIPLMLNKFQQGLNKQVQLKFYKQLKKSQINLSFYRSQGKQSAQHSFRNPQNQQNLENPQISPSKLLKREKFFSLYSGKPENDEIMFPSFDLFVKGKNRAKIQQHYQMNINKIQKQLNTFYTQQNISESVPIPKKDMKYPRKLSITQQNMYQLNIANKKQKSFFDQVQINKNSSKMFIVNQKNNHNKIQSQNDILKKSQISIQKSQKSSKQMIKTMTRFLKTKSESRRKYDNMVDFYHYDRPLTNRIRRSQYKLDNKNNSQLQDFRMHSQMQRQAYLKKNSQAYHKILNMLSNFHQDDIPISLQILLELRSFFINQYFLTQKNFQQILQKIKHEIGYQKLSSIKKNEKAQFNKQIQQEEGQKIDFMIQKVLEVINKFYGFQCQWYQ